MRGERKAKREGERERGREREKERGGGGGGEKSSTSIYQHRSLAVVAGRRTENRLKSLNNSQVKPRVCGHSNALVHLCT